MSECDDGCYADGKGAQGFSRLNCGAAFPFASSGGEKGHKGSGCKCYSLCESSHAFPRSILFRDVLNQKSLAWRCFYDPARVCVVAFSEMACC